MTAGPARLTVLYDADCGICRLTIRALARLDWRRRLEFEPLQSFVAMAPGDPSRRELLRSLHVRDGHRRWQRGGDAMLEIASVVPLLLPLSLVGRRPGMHAPVEATYRMIAANRQAIGRVLEAVTGPIRSIRSSADSRRIAASPPRRPSKCPDSREV